MKENVVDMQKNLMPFPAAPVNSPSKSMPVNTFNTDNRRAAKQVDSQQTETKTILINAKQWKLHTILDDATITQDSMQ